MARSGRVWFCYAVAFGVFALQIQGQAQTVGGTWEALGPGPAQNGQVEGVPDGEVVGAVNALAAHPTDADILYAGGANGGIWRTDSATSSAPLWVRQTDDLGSLSIGAIEIDPTDSSSQTLVAGIARTSSLLSIGGDALGMLRTTDGGSSWELLNPGGNLDGRQIAGVAGRGSILVAATGDGVFRSDNTGVSFVQVSGAGGSGLPSGLTSDLTADPTSASRLYTPVLTGAALGIYRSDDSGATWVKVSDAAIDASLGAGSPKTEMAVGASGQVFVAIVDAGRLADVFRSSDGQTAWASLGVPITVEDGDVEFGIHPGAQGGLHLSIAADPVNSDIVYLGGDRQPFFSEGSGGATFFPNSLGANDFSGRLFRADASLPPETRWAPITHVGAANNSAPHADSRDMLFDALGNLIESDDGGIYKRETPQLATGGWTSLNGSLQTTEYHGIAWDSVSNRVIGGAQDTGTTEQIDAGSAIFNSVSTADGGDPAVEDRSSATESTRYSSSQFLGGFRRRTVNTANVVTAVAFPDLSSLNGDPNLQAQFYTPIAVHDSNGMRLLLGASNGLYESLDRGDTVSRISEALVNRFDGDPLVYGVSADPELAYFAAGNSVFLRNSGSAGAFMDLGDLGARVRDVDINRLAPQELFAITQSTVQYSSNGGANFTDVTGNLLATFSPGRLRTMAHLGQNLDAIAVATDRGTYVAFGSSGFLQWSRLGTGLPNVVVFELEYDEIDDLLIAGTLGRGAWSFPLSSVQGDRVFRNGFE